MILRQIPVYRMVNTLEAIWAADSNQITGLRGWVCRVVASTGSVDSTMTISCTRSRIIMYECAEKISTCDSRPSVLLTDRLVSLSSSSTRLTPVNLSRNFIPFNFPVDRQDRNSNTKVRPSDCKFEIQHYQF